MSRSLGSLTLDLIAKTANFTGPMDKASANYKRNADEINKSTQLISRGIAAAGTAILAGLSVSAVTRYADEWTDLQSRVVAATGSQQAANETMRALFDTARNTYSAFSQTNEIFLANSTVLQELGYNTQKQIDFTAALNNALVAGGTKAQAATSVVEALSKALATGELRGQNFNTVIGSGGRVAQALADSLGVTTIELRKMAADGLLTTSVIVDGLVSQLPRVAEEAAKMPATVGDGLLLINNSTSLLVGTLDQAIMTTGSLADVLVGIADGMSDFAQSLDAADIVTGIELVKDTTIILAGVISGRLVGALAESAAGYAAKTVAAIRDAQATASASAAEVAYARVVQGSLLVQLAAAKSAVEKAAVRKQLAANTALLTAETARYNAAVAATSVSARAASIAVGLKGAALAAVGGPMGAAVLAGTAIYVLSTRLDENARALKAIEGPLDTAIAKYREMGAEARRSALAGLQEESDKLEKQLQDLESRLSGRSTGMNTWGQSFATNIQLSEKAQADLRLQIEKVNDALEENRKKFDALGDVPDRSILRVSRALDELIESNEYFAFSATTITDDVVSGYEKLNQQMQKRIALYGNESQAAALLYDIQNGLIKLNPGEDALLIASAKRLDALTAEAKAAKEAADAHDQLKRTFQGIADRIDPGTAALNRYNQEQKTLFDALGAGIIDLQRFDELMSGLDGEFIDSLLIDVDAIGRGIGESADEAESIYTGMWERIGAAGSDVFMGILNDADNSFAGIGDLFKRLLAEMANEALITPITLQFKEAFSGSGSGGGQGGSNTGNAASAIGAGGIWGAIAVAVVAGVNEHNKNQEAKFGYLAAEIRQGVQSTGTLLGMANAKSESIANVLTDMGDKYSDVLSVNRGMYRALLDIRAGLTGVASGFARSFTLLDDLNVNTGTTAFIDSGKVSGESALRNLMDSWGGGTELNNFVNGFLGALGDKVTKEIFKKKVSVLDSGIQIIGSSLADILTTGAVEAFSYADVQTKKKTFGITTSNKVKTQTESLGDLFESQLASVFENAADALAISSATYGIDFDAFVNRLMVDPLKLSLKDLEGDEITAEIERFLSSTVDGWAGILLAGTDILQRYQEVGEGAFETMVRLSTQTEHFKEMLGFVGIEFALAGVEAVKATQEIAAFAGGFDALSGSLSVYYDKFFTDAEKFDNLSSQLATATDGLLDSLPETTAQFRDIITAIDTTTEAGQRQFAALINLSGPMYEYIQGLEKQGSALAEFMRPFVGTLEDFGLSDFEKSMVALTRAFDSNIAKAQELGASEEQLAIIRAAADIDMQSLLSARASELSDFLQPFLQIVDELGLSDFEKSMVALTRAFDSNIAKAQELGASEEQLAVIRAEAGFQLQELLVTQTDAAMNRLSAAIAEQIGALNSDAENAIGLLRTDHDARVKSLDAWLDTQLSHYERRAAVLASSIADLTALSSALDSAAQALRPVSDVGQQMAYSAALSSLGAIAAGVAAGGALPSAEAIQGITAALQGGDRYYSTFSEYALATASALANVDALAGVTGQQLTADEKLLAAVERGEQTARDNHTRMLSRMQTDLDAQIAAINEQNALAVEAVEQQRKDAEDRIAAMRGIDVAVYSLEQVVQQVHDAINLEARQREQVEAQANQIMLEQIRIVGRNTADLVDEFNRWRMDVGGAA